jgi:hypothetical protein
LQNWCGQSPATPPAGIWQLTDARCRFSDKTIDYAAGCLPGHESADMHCRKLRGSA